MFLSYLEFSDEMGLRGVQKEEAQLSGLGYAGGDTNLLLSFFFG